jgi:hypothetical protein
MLTINKFSLYVSSTKSVKKLFTPKGTIKDNYHLDLQ